MDERQILLVYLYARQLHFRRVIMCIMIFVNVYVMLYRHYDDIEAEEESSFSINQTSSTNSTLLSRRKRKNPYDNMSDRLGKLAKSIENMMDKSNEQMENIVEVIVDSARKKEHDQHNSMWEELTRLEISVDECIDVMDIVNERPWTVNVFKSLSDAKKLEFVRLLLKTR